MSIDPYQVLGVPYNATEDEIKKKYRKLVKQYHPDLHPNDPAAAQKMSEINAAYELIKSGQAAEYSQAAQTDSTDFGNTDDFLNSFFSAFGFQTAASQMDENELYSKIRSYLASGNLDAAASYLNRMVLRRGKWNYYAAQLSAASGEYADAVRYADEARRFEPYDPEYAELSAEYHKRFDAVLKRRSILPILASALTIMLTLNFIASMVVSFFAKLF
ncbi:MAG: J domain-containing protein [Oscillospiraceae bacterium]|nr:J domain-containing protein [Oscillospiraceae bacterium]